MNNRAQLRNIFSPNIKEQTVQQISSDSCLRKNKVPKNISADKETLYEQLLLEKSRNKQMHKDLHSLTLYQKVEQDLVDSAPVSRKHVHQILFKKEQELQQLKQSAQFREIQELRNQLNQALQQLESQKILKSHKEDMEWIVDDNLDLIRQIESLQAENQQLGKTQAQLITLKAAYKQQQKVLNLKEQQLEKYRKRDPLQDLSIKQKSKNDQILMDELEHKKDEIYNLQTQVSQLRKALTEEQKLHQALQLEHSNKIQAWEGEKYVLKQHLDQLQKENQVLIDKSKLIDRYMMTQKRKSMIIDDNVNSLKFISQSQIADDQIVRCVKKTDIETQILTLKYNLRYKNISLMQAEEVYIIIMIVTVQKQIINIDCLDIVNNIKGSIQLQQFSHDISLSYRRQPKRVQSWSNHREYAYNPELQVPVTIVKCVFRTMLDNYQLLDQDVLHEVQSMIPKIKDNFQTQLTFNIQQLKDCVSKYNVKYPISKFIDTFIQLYFNNYQQFSEFEVAKI